MFLTLLRALVFSAALTLMAASHAVPAAADDSEPSGELRQARQVPAVSRTMVLADVRATSPTTASLRTMGALARAKSLGRCFALESVRYCLGQGFTESAPEYLALAKAPTTGVRGDLSFGVWAKRRAALTNAARVAAEQAEMSGAFESLPGAQRLADALASYRSARVGGRQADILGLLPANTIMSGKQTRQLRSYWCGPATMQSIAWGASGKSKPIGQSVWADRLGTYSGGTDIGNMVRQYKKTTWLKKGDVRGHLVFSVARLTADEFYFVHRWNLGFKGAAMPVIEHPRLIKKSFRYLKYDHSGHFQVGRGYRTVGVTPKIKIFEVFNERDYRRDGYTTWGPREVSADSLLKATLANSGHKNIGL